MGIFLYRKSSTATIRSEWTGTQYYTKVTIMGIFLYRKSSTATIRSEGTCTQYYTKVTIMGIFLYRKSSTATIRSEGTGTQYYTKVTIMGIFLYRKSSTATIRSVGTGTQYYTKVTIMGIFLYRKSSTATIRSEGTGTQYYTKVTIMGIFLYRKSSTATIRSVGTGTQYYTKVTIMGIFLYRKSSTATIRSEGTCTQYYTKVTIMGIFLYRKSSTATIRSEWTGTQYYTKVTIMGIFLYRKSSTATIRSEGTCTQYYTKVTIMGIFLYRKSSTATIRSEGTGTQYYTKVTIMGIFLYRKSSTATIRSEGTGTQYYTKQHGGVLQMYDSDNSSLGSQRSSTASTSTIRIRRVSSMLDGSTRFPKLQECAHFHYDFVELHKIQVSLCDEDQENHHHGETDVMERTFLVKTLANDKSWTIRRTFKNFKMLDRQLHRCIYDRKFSRLPNLNQEEDTNKTYKEMEEMLSQYLQRFSRIAGSMINCGSVLNWFELDNRGNRLLATDDSGINTPAIAAAHAIKRYTAQAPDEISLEVGDIVSVIDMPQQEETIWWRGKRGFEVGFFPSECVEVIGDKVPASVESRIPDPNAMVRKHGKFLSFLRMFFTTRPARNQLKQSGIVKERVFGCDLGEHLLNTGQENTTDVPLVLKCCSEVIEEHGIVDGIYRLSGITSNIQKLRLAFDEDRVPDLTTDVYLQDIHSISSLLKMYFRELPNPLLTYQLYNKFADAVRDEDNKLWKIHDVVQQLPPPHYRTLEYLMRHLAKVAAYGPDTGMHSKNLAIVWAPNLLRSKELETGGGAAALQGVGIQAVVTECLILYADLIFSDKMPSYSSPELKSAQRKPRPKSLAISTPTKLITLEEARERALSASLRPPPQKYIDVGGGPERLPSRYHTVIDLPGYRKKTLVSGSNTVGYGKSKKSPSGWRSIFSRGPRQGSIKQKGRKNSIGEPLGLSEDRKAITEEDVHNWKRRRLRGAKSAESLLAMSLPGLDCGRISRDFEESLYRIYSDDESKHPSIRHKRSLSSESPRALMHSDHSVSYPSFIMTGSREVGIDVDASGTSSDTPDSTPTENGVSDNRPERKQSFVRGDNKRKVITHRRSPSGPSSPRQEQEKGANSSSKSADKPNKADLPPGGVRKSQEGQGDCDKFVLHVKDANLLKTADQRKSPSLLPNVSPEEKREHGRRGSRTPPIVRGRLREDKIKDKNSQADDGKVVTIELPESPGAKRKNWMGGSGGSTPAGTPDEPPTSHFYYSRHHDYAEILSDEEKSRFGIEEETKTSPMDISGHIETTFGADKKMYVDTCRSVGTPSSSLSSPTTSDPSSGTSECVRNIDGKIVKMTSSTVLQQSVSETNDLSVSKMSKCLSVPADIQKSLEDMTSCTGSRDDMLSSITISELSASTDSFARYEDNHTAARRRRSASVDSFNEAESPLTRTLREINAQIDKAFRRDLDKANHLQEGERPNNRSRSGSFDNIPSDYQGDHIGFSSPNIIPPLPSDSGDAKTTFVERPAEEIQVIETARVIRAPLRPSAANQTKLAHINTQNASPTGSDISGYSEGGKLSPRQAMHGASSQQSSCLPSPMSPEERAKFGLSDDEHPVKSRNPDNKMKRSDSRHGCVEFDLSDEDLEFLSRQGILQEMKTMRRVSKDETTSSPVLSPTESVSSPVQWSQEMGYMPQSFSGSGSAYVGGATYSPATASEAKACEGSPTTKSHSVHKTKPPARREFAKLMLESDHDSSNKSSKSSPRSPRQQPRWEDLAGLNQDFGALPSVKHATKVESVKAQKDKVKVESESASEEFDRKLQSLSDFNDVWRQQLAPTGDVCRTVANDDHVLSSSNRFRPQLKKSQTVGAIETTLMGSRKQRDKTPECCTQDQTVTMEKPMIKKCLTESDIPQIRQCSIMTQDSQSTTSSSGTSDALTEIHSITDRMTVEKPSIRRDELKQSDSKLPTSQKCEREEKASFPKPRKIQKMDSFDFPRDSSVQERMDTSGPSEDRLVDNQYSHGATALSHIISSSQSESTSNSYNTNNIGGAGHYSESSRSENTAFTDRDHAQPFQSMLEDIDVNESCFGIPTHQNLSNEFREKMNERLKSQSQQSSLDSPSVVAMESFVYQEQSEHEVHVGFARPVVDMSHIETAAHFDQGEYEGEFQSSTRMEVEAGMSSISLPTENLCSLSQGPVVMATNRVIDMLDNTEEAHQNAINADLELTMSQKSPKMTHDMDDFDDDDACCSKLRNMAHEDNYSTAESPWQQNLSDLPELPPPEREFMEVSRPSVIKCSKSRKKSEPRTNVGIRRSMSERTKADEAHLQRREGGFHRTGAQKAKSEKEKKTADKTGAKGQRSERGETKLVMERKTSLKKGKDSVNNAQYLETGEASDADTNDDVFVDTNTSAVQDIPKERHRFNLERSPLSAFLNDPPSRSSLDESFLQVASSRHDDFLSRDDEGQQEDIRFTRAHRSTKLKSLRELFEKTAGEYEASHLKKQSSSSSQEKLVCLPGGEIENTETVRLHSARSAFAARRSQSHTERFVMDKENVSTQFVTTSDEWQMPRSRRSISTDIGYELGRRKETTRRERSWDRQSSFTSASKPPKHRSCSRNRTASESSVSESENRVGSSKSSPKSQRDGCSSDGSPKSRIPTKIHDTGSPKLCKDASLRNSPKTQHLDGATASPKSRKGSESPFLQKACDISIPSQRNRQRTDDSPKVLRRVSFGRSDNTPSEGSPKSPRAWRSPGNRRSLSIETSIATVETVEKDSVVQRSSERTLSQSCILPSSKGSQGCVEDWGGTEGCNLERRGSIKELREFFEQKHDTDTQSAENLLLRSRVRSVSPTLCQSHRHESLETVNVRHSLELPSRGATPPLEGSVRSQPVRLGPKPFYGARK
ncbi:uncharacterized protein LOC117341471 isoform X2 [Pecten maximus]|uniref:uncharacterized protein LOC117341471 isoform X2 n=1 Tax=Pecten maximus TaxID=6579 RepID=UPI0014584ACA|nr:uncharacterized protein LOC117341471 isoform X2 [Pecten maximus]